MKAFKLLVLFGSFLWIISLPTGQSLWNDEAITASWASHECFQNLFYALLLDDQSESQMPFYIFFSWVSAKIVGTGEWQLRIPNFLWGVLAIVSLYLTGRRLRIWWIYILFIIMPFFVYYMDEARPYAMQMGISCWLLYGMVACIESQGQSKNWPYHIGLSGLLLCSSSMLGAITLGAVLMTISLIFLHHKWRIKREAVIALTSFFVLISFLGAYFTWTLLRGAGGARLWDVGITNFGFAIFEFSGANGLTEPRYVLRDLAKKGQYGLLSLKLAGPSTFFGILYIIILGLPVFSLRKSRYSIYWIAMALVVSISFWGLLMLALIAKWPFWGRHLAPAFPFFVAWLALSAVIIYQQNNKKIACTLTGILAIVLMVSNINLHFNQRFQKEDYRYAAALAKKQVEQGKVVWWVAYDAPARYYEVSLKPFGDWNEGTIKAVNLDRKDMEKVSKPDIIVYSRPEDLDRNNVVSQLIKQHNFKEKAKLHGLLIYESN